MTVVLNIVFDVMITHSKKNAIRKEILNRNAIVFTFFINMCCAQNISCYSWI